MVDLRGTASVLVHDSASSGHERLELSAFDHALQHRGDLAFFTVEHVEDLPQLVPLLFDLVAEIKSPRAPTKIGTIGISSVFMGCLISVVTVWIMAEDLVPVKDSSRWRRSR